MKLTVVIPVYNASSYLKRCVNSVLNQGLQEQEYEIILINDGSKDNSLKICNEYTRLYPSVIKVISKPNEGVSFTRNRGLKEACGDYVYFIDADDYLIPGGFRYLFDTYLTEKIDVLSFRSITLDDYVLKTYTETNNVEGVICFEGTGLGYYRKNYHSFIWANIYRSSFLKANQIQFENLVIGEDVLFNLKVHMADPIIRIVSSNIYRYTVHSDSAIKRRDSDFMRRSIDSYIILLTSLNHYSLLYKEEDVLLYQNLRLMLFYQFVPFMSRVLSSDYSSNDFLGMKKNLLSIGVLPIEEVNKSARFINFLFSYPKAFIFFKWIYKKIFIPFVLPKLKRN